jgi:surface polysaccharide O-acyltransferase-like enzyme
MIERGLYEHFSAERTNDLSTATSEPKLKRIIRSTGSVLLGLIATAVLSLATDVVMHSTGIYPPWGQPMGDSQFVLATVYRSIYAILGSYIAAQFAPFQPMQHALALAIVGMILAIAGTIATWNGGPEYARKWYPITLILVSVPCGWLGGKLQARRSQK